MAGAIHADHLHVLQRNTMPSSLRTPHGQILSWAFTLTCDALDPLSAKYPELELKKNGALFGDIFQAAHIVGSMIRIERYLGKHDFSAFHHRLIEGIDLSVRSRYVASIQQACSFLLKMPVSEISPDTIPDLGSLIEKEEKDIRMLIGLWIAWSLLGRKPKLDHELHFTSDAGDLAFSVNAKFIASVFLSDKNDINREV